MSSKVDKVVKTYKTLLQIPALTGGTILSPNLVNTTWSQRNIEKGKTTKFLRTTITENLQKVAEVPPLDIGNESLSRNSSSNKYRAILRESDSKQYLEIWQSHNIIRTVDLSALDLHGTVYSDADTFAFEWSPDEKKVLYIAEKKPPKTEPFYKRKGKNEGDGDSSEKGPEKEPKKGEEYLFRQDWGEQMVGKIQSIIAQYDIENDKIDVLEGLPEHIFAAQTRYSPDGTYIVGVAYDLEPRKLGLIYCTNRKSTIFKLDFQSNYVALNLAETSVKSPIFTPDGKYLVWLQRKSGGPHASCMQLVKTALPLTENSVVETVVDFVNTQIKIKNDRVFYGLYNSGFPRQCWASDNRLLLNTNQKYTINSYVIDLDNGEITELEYQHGSQLILDVSDDLILAVRRNFLVPDKVVLGKLPQKGAENSILWHELTSSTTVEGLEDCFYEYLDLSADGDAVRDFNAIYVGPKSGKDKEIPLIVWPHGGPHSAFANFHMLELAVFLSFKYAVLLVNYRGSLGSGQDSVNFLPGKVGSADVKDCMLATDSVLKRYQWLNPGGVALCGGSHGGFLVTHLSGQFPDKFRAVVARNPVIDIASMSVISDIPDWCYVEAGKEYSQKGQIDDDILLKMRRISPIFHAHKVKAPTLLQIGSKDLRVPPHQGTEYYLRLKANGVKTRMNLYEDSHPLGSVPNEMDNIINTFLWIDEHISS